MNAPQITTDSVIKVYAPPTPAAPENISIPINFLTVGAIIRAAEIDALVENNDYARCHLEAEAQTVRQFTCADCLCRLNYVGLFNRARERSFAVCPECKRGFEI